MIYKIRDVHEDGATLDETLSNLRDEIEDDDSPMDVDWFAGLITDLVEGIYEDRNKARIEAAHRICRCLGIDLSQTIKPTAESGVIPLDPTLITDKIFLYKKISILTLFF